MTNSLLIFLCVVTIFVTVSFAFIVYFVTKLAGTVARLNASNNVYEYLQMDRAAKMGSRAVREQAEEELTKGSGQTQTDGTMSDAGLEALSKII